MNQQAFYPKPNVLDLSHHNVIRDMSKLKEAGIIGIIHKATQGIGYHDAQYSERRKAARNLGLLWGAYAFNTGDEVKRQVDNFFLYADPDENTLMCLDFEDNPRSNMTLDQACEFLELCDDRLGRKAWIYSGNRVKDLLGNKVDEFFGSHPLWLAQYGPRPRIQVSWKRYSLWQFSEHGRLIGTDGNLDFNHADEDQLRKEWAGGGEPLVA